MQKLKLSTFLTVLLGGVIVLNFLWNVYNYRNDIFKKFDSSYWTKRYQASQWVVPNSKNSIGDDGLYMYVGYRYMQGDDPTLLNAQLPPLGKYFVGLFESLIGINGAFSVFFGALTLLLFYVFNKSVFKSSLISLLPVAFFSIEPLFTAQLRAPYLDTIYLCFLLLGFIFFLKNKYILAGMSLGAFMAIKSPFLVGVVYLAFFLWLILQKKFSIRKVIFLVAPAIIIFLLSYTVTFFHGHGVIYLLKVQKYILHFYSSGAKAVIGAVFPMLMTGSWYNWFGPVEHVQEWIVFWPIISIGTICSAVIYLKRSDRKVLFQLLWVATYLVFLIITPLFARYLLLLIPFLYNLSIWAFFAAIKPKFLSA